MNAEPTKTWDSKNILHPRQILGCKLTPDGTRVAAGDFDGQLHLWNLADDAKVTLSAHQTWVQALVFHPDGQRLFSTDYWGVIHCWPFTQENARPTWSIVDAHQSWIRAAILSPDGRHLVTAGNDAVIRVWNVDNGAKVRELVGHESHIFSLAFHKDGHLISGDQLGVIHEWDMATGRKVRTFDGKALWHSPESTMSLCGIGGVRSLGFNGDGSLLFAGGITEPSSPGFAAGKPALSVFDWATGQVKAPLRFKEPFEGFVIGLIWHPDGYLIGAGGGVNGALWFWRPADSEPFHTVKQIKHLREVNLHSDNRRIVAACFEQRGNGGNGRNQPIEQYTDNSGSIRVYSMTERPAPARPAPRPRT